MSILPWDYTASALVLHIVTESGLLVWLGAFVSAALFALLFLFAGDDR